ncbi:MAG: Lrp/AsnC family transcriptional regulator [Rhodococcus sp. (in: high G+C Gram-positive bacteria)]
MAETPTRIELDDVDRAILRELTTDGRMSMRVLADRVHISRAHAYTRVERLQEAGVIEHFTVQVDHTASGLTTSAFIALSIRQDSWRAVAGKLKQMPFVEHFSLLGGDFDVLVLVRAPDNETLRHVVLEGLQGVDGVRSTRTWLIFDEARGGLNQLLP